MNEAFLSLTEAARAIRAKQITPLTLVEALLQRSAKLDPRVQAWARLDVVGALAQAHILTREAREDRVRGPLHGVPIAVKDNFDTAGLETTAGSQLLRDRVPADDAAAVKRLRDAGAIVLGKTAMTVFAAMDPAPTRNPWNLECTPGGSSSGSAAAVAAYFVPAAIGSQTAGSILRPASYCGVIGLKPTYDAIDRHGLYPCAWSMDHAGPLTRTVAEARLMFEVLAGTPVQTFEAIDSSARGCIIGVPNGSYFRDGVAPETQAAFAQAIDRLRDAGATIVELELPASFGAGVDAGIIAMYAEMAAVHADRYPDQRGRYGWKLACLLDAGRSIGSTDYLRAQQVRRIATDDLSAVLADVDCLATPTTPAPAPQGLDATGDWRFNLPFSATGHPAMSIPVGLSSPVGLSPTGLPIGMQLVARHRGEARLFRVAAALEAVARFPASPFRNL